MKINNLALIISVLLAASPTAFAGQHDNDHGFRPNNSQNVSRPAMYQNDRSQGGGGVLMDLHSHTYCSDGVNLPEAAVDMAKKANIKYFAITDHDTTACVGRAQAYAAKYPGMKVISGIEITANDNTHILGLNVDMSSPGLKKISEDSRKHRIERMRKYVERLNEMLKEKNPAWSISVREVLTRKLTNEMVSDKLPTDKIASMSEEEMLASIKGMMTRPDVARLLMDKKYARDNRDAFDNWMTPANVPGESLPLKTVIDAVHAAGGVAILAHPYSIYKFGGFPQKYGENESFNDMDSLMKAMLEAGLDGIEAFKLGWQRFPEDHKMILNIAKNWKAQTGKDLILSVGADYHGVPNVGGRYLMTEYAPMEVQESIKKALHLN